MTPIKVKTNPSFMTKHKDVLVVGGVMVLLAGAAVTYYLTRKKKENQPKTDQASLSAFSDASSTHTTRPYQTPSFVSVPSSESGTTSQHAIKYGSRHPDVKILQRYLKIYNEDLGRSGPKRDGVDGVFGPKTSRAALKRLKKTVFYTSDIEGMRKALKSLGK